MQLGQMEPNLAVSIYVRSSIKFLLFVPFHQQIWPPRAILVSDWLLFKKIFSSETAWPNGAKFGRKHLCKVQTWHRWSLGMSFSKLCPTAPPSIQDGYCFFKVMIISLWNLLQYHSIVRWAIQAQWAEPLVISYDFNSAIIISCHLYLLRSMIIM